MIFQSHMANIRWLCIPSETSGEDWLEKSSLLDSSLESLGMDLAEEAVYLLFSEAPSDILEGNGQCLIARSVIGPKRSVGAPLKLIDWKAAPVLRERILGEGLTEILENAQDLHFKAQKDSKDLARDFALCVKRELVPELKLRVEAIFHE